MLAKISRNSNFDITSQLFDDLLWGLRPYEQSIINQKFNVTSEEKDGKLTLQIEVPGVKRENLQLSVEKQTITLSAKRNAETVKHSWVISEKYDASTAEAQLSDGVLEVTVNLHPKAQVRSIAIK